MKRTQVAALVAVGAFVAGAVAIWHDSKPMVSSNGTITHRLAADFLGDRSNRTELNEFADEIYDRTDGRYKIEVYHNGQLGAEIDTN